MQIVPLLLKVLRNINIENNSYSAYSFIKCWQNTNRTQGGFYITGYPTTLKKPIGLLYELTTPILQQNTVVHSIKDLNSGIVLYVGKTIEGHRISSISTDFTIRFHDIVLVVPAQTLIKNIINSDRINDKKVDISKLFCSSRDILLREGFSSCIYTLMALNNELHIVNISTGKIFVKSINVEKLKYWKRTNSITEDEFKRLLPLNMNIDNFKIVDSVEVYNNLKNL